MAVATSLTASVIQSLIFFPKLYIILRKPEKNVRQSLIVQRGSGQGTKFLVLALPDKRTAVSLHSRPPRSQVQGLLRMRS